YEPRPRHLRQSRRHDPDHRPVADGATFHSTPAALHPGQDARLRRRSRRHPSRPHRRPGARHSARPGVDRSRRLAQRHDGEAGRGERARSRVSGSLMRWMVIALLLMAAKAVAGPVTPEQAVHFRRASGLAFSPDGKQLVCAVSGFENGKPRAHLWKLGTSGELEQWTTADAADRSPQWSPDGKWVAFVSSRTGSAPIYFLASDSAP